MDTSLLNLVILPCSLFTQDRLEQYFLSLTSTIIVQAVQVPLVFLIPLHSTVHRRWIHKYCDSKMGKWLPAKGFHQGSLQHLDQKQDCIALRGRCGSSTTRTDRKLKMQERAINCSLPVGALCLWHYSQSRPAVIDDNMYPWCFIYNPEIQKLVEEYE